MVVLLISASLAYFFQDPVMIHEDVVYREVEGVALRLDIAVPNQGEGPFPVVLAIHGGAWRAGNKGNMRSAIERFAGEGYVAVSPQYRLVPDHLYPSQIHDVKAAVRWLRTHAETYWIDPDRIAALGFSAGGHLALMLGVSDPDDGLEGLDGDGDPTEVPSSRVQAVINYFGPTDLAAADIPLVSIPLRDALVGGPLDEKAELVRQASPITMLSPDDPPILTFQGTKDPLVPPTQATLLANAMTELEVDGRVELLIGAGHGWPDPELDRTIRMSLEFLDRHLRP